MMTEQEAVAQQHEQLITTELDAAQYILTQPLKQQDIATPWWPKVDGLLALRDVSGEEGMDWGSEKAGRNSEMTMNMLGEMIVRTLIFKPTGKPLFTIKQRQSIAAQLGLTILLPLITEIYEFLGLGGQVNAAIAEAKKNLGGTNGNSSGMS